MSEFQFAFTLSLNFILFILFNLIFTAIIITLERKSPATTLAWLFFMILLPGIGFIFYLLFSQNISKRKVFKYTVEETKTYTSLLKFQREQFQDHTFQFHDPEMLKHTDLILFHNKLSDSFYSQDNHVDIITDGKVKFSTLFEEIRRAKHHIHVQYYIMKNDAICKELYTLLIKKAKEGVIVRLLGDHIGCRHMSDRTIKALKQSGVQLAQFFPSRFKLINAKANYRNHRKIVVIDGNVGFIGGFNVGDEYLGLNRKFGYWRDTHLRISGSAVIGLQLRFLLDWRAASHDSFDISAHYFRDVYERSDGKIGMQIVSSGPDNINEQVKQGYIKMIASAKRTIVIQTPYFIPDDAIMESLKIAAVSGVDVRIMIPNKPDHMFVYWATYSYIGELIQYGVRAYTYENGFLHTKMIAVDSEISSIGTCNFDIRSFKLNFEVNAFIYDQHATKRLEDTFYKDVPLCKEITKEIYKNRSQIIKTKETISRLFSPVL